MNQVSGGPLETASSLQAQVTVPKGDKTFNVHCTSNLAVQTQVRQQSCAVLVLSRS